jgi:4-amino-4-deoxy-L-arabinose transferase-like glycosyltransferase
VSNRNFFILLFLAVVVYAFNLNIDVMEVDAAQYAAISWEMFITHSFFKVHCLTGNYLDKPPLLFWLTTLSFSVFGAHNFSYKLPSLLFALLAVFSTYQLAKLYYNEKTARMAAVMLATTQALFLITNDVRTDTLLMGAVIFAIWQLAGFFEAGKTLNLLAGSFGVALALLAKGPIGLIATGAALLPQLILKGTWRKLLDFRLLTGALVIAIMLTPMCIGLYQQFGWHGLKFYFWTQSFGRVTGASEWNNHPDTFFLLHTTAWAFLPWSLFLLIGWVSALAELIKSRLKISPGAEIISVSGFTLVLIMLMLSKYQLPHYAFIVYPLGAIMAVKGFLQMARWPKARPWLTALQLLFLITLPLGSLLLQYALKGADAISMLCIVVLYPFAMWLAIEVEGGTKTFYTVTRYVSYRFSRLYNGLVGNKHQAQITAAFALDVVYQKLFFASALMFIVFNFLLSAFYFPAILKYQPECDFGRYIKTHTRNNNFVCYFNVYDFSLMYYSRQLSTTTLWKKEDFKKLLDDKKELLVYGSTYAISMLKEDHIPYSVISERERYHVANLSLPFLNPATRSSVCEKVYLLDVKEP